MIYKVFRHRNVDSFPFLMRYIKLVNLDHNLDLPDNINLALIEDFVVTTLMGKFGTKVDYCADELEVGTIIHVVSEKNRLIHCKTGPAVIYPDGQKSWYYYGIKTTPMELFDRLSIEEKEKVIWKLNEWTN